MSYRNSDFHRDPRHSLCFLLPDVNQGWLWSAELRVAYAATASAPGELRDERQLEIFHEIALSPHETALFAKK